MQFVWDDLGSVEWSANLTRVRKSNMLNTWAYARAVRFVNQKMSHFGSIVSEGETIGLIQYQEVRLAGIFQTIQIHRGPLWFEDHQSIDNWQRFLILLNKTFPKRIGRVRRFLPELIDNTQNQELMTMNGFTRIGEGYETIWVDLTAEQQALRANLKSNWRNRLNKAERGQLKIKIETDQEALDWLLAKYTEDKAQRQYGGPDPKFALQMASELLKTDQGFVIRAFEGETPVSGVLVLIHGRSATDHIGWTSDLGRELRAHHQLLWSSMLLLKDRGIQWFDLGGINPEHAEGVTTFKQGMGGTSYKTVGLYK